MFPYSSYLCTLIALYIHQCGAGKIRCYCNLPECEADNNLCTVDEDDGACFSDFLDYRAIYKARQGCLYDLPKSRQDLCGNAPGSTGAPRSLLLCCQVDMCNQRTHSIISSFLNATEGESVFNPESGNSGTPPLGYNNHEVWFKAATIAVPICGAMILLMLVALACKILRSDHVTVDKFCHDASNAAAQLNQYSLSHGHDATKKVPLLFETLQNSQDFRNVTTTRIHYGQNVNVLKERPLRPEKNVNVEYARVGEESSTVVVVEHDNVESSSNSESSDTSPHETLDVRVEDPTRSVPSFNLNLEKSKNVESCNIYKCPRQSGELLLTDKCIKYSDKHLA